MRVVYLGNNKPAAIDGLKYLKRKNIDIVVVVGPTTEKPSFGKERLIDIAHNYDIPTTTDDELYRHLDDNKISTNVVVLDDIDLVISFCFWKKITKPLITLPKIGCINFHAAPLPGFRGLAGFNIAIYENLSYWGVTAHFVSETFDTGDIIKEIKFDINPKEETAYSLEQKSLSLMYDLFVDVINIAYDNDTLPRYPQVGKGRYISKQEFEHLRKIQTSDTLEEIERKIRAFWYPPHEGASIEIKGKEYTVINQNVLKEIGIKYW